MKGTKANLGSIVVAAAMLFAATASDGAKAENETQREESAPKSIDRVMGSVYPALVRIDVITVQPRSGRLRKSQAAGSGVIISEDGYVITNHHVAGKGVRFVCRMPDGEEIDAELTGTDPLADIAVLKLDLDDRENPSSPLPVAHFGDSDEVQVGDVVYAMGSPAALSQSVTRGIVSNTALIMSRFAGSMKLDGEKVGSLVRWIAHDAKIFGGNSGGPLVDQNGKIIGINEIAVAGLSGAIPANLAKSVATQIIETGEVDRSWLGIDGQPVIGDAKQTEGVLVGGVIEDSPAEEAGILPGDVILEYDGTPVKGRIQEDLPIFNALVMSTPIGTEVELRVWRDGEELELAVQTDPRERARGRDKEIKSWGMTMRNLTRLSALEMRRENKEGVLVVTMRPGGPAKEAEPELKRDDIIVKIEGHKVKNVADLREISQDLIGESEERVPALVEIERGTENLYTVVEIGMDPENERPAQARKAWLPVVTQVLTRDLAEKLGLAGQGGVRITQLYPGHSADEAGLQRGDILLEVDGMTIDAHEPEDSDVLYHMIRQYKIGSTVELELVRNGESMQIPVELEDPPTPKGRLETYEDEYFEITVREISLDDRLKKQIDKSVKGVLVKQVKRAGWSALAGIKSGDILLTIDGQDTRSADAVEKILEQARRQEKESLIFFIKRGIHTMYIELEPSWDEYTDTRKGE